ncbi:MAG: PadR family transcriptional regulator [Clostridiales bacterium]|nr:PadR family transcriptional regulator [Clostridiales bacterium]
MNSQLKRGVLELCVLSIVKNADCYGYELVNKISDFMHITEGTVYPLLKRLKDNKQIQSYIVESNEGPARKYYKITENGLETQEKMQKEWLDFVENVNNLINNEMQGRGANE